MFNFLLIDKRCDGQPLQLALLHSINYTGFVFHAQSCSWCAKRVLKKKELMSH
jgi:hypothetical protein